MEQLIREEEYFFFFSLQRFQVILKYRMNTCRAGFFSLFRKSNILSCETCRWTELVVEKRMEYEEIPREIQEDIGGSRADLYDSFEDRVHFARTRAFAVDCTLAIISTRHSGRRFIVTNVTVSYD